MLESGFGIPINNRSGKSDNKNGCLWISQEELNANNIDLLKDILKTENVPLNYWILLAYSYKRLGYVKSFELLLREVEILSNCDDKWSTSDIKGFISSALAVHNFYQSEQVLHDDERHSRYLDWANHYIRKAEGLSSYSFCIAKGQQHLMSSLRNKDPEARASAKSLFHMAMSQNPRGIIPIILYANVLVMENNLQDASVYYVRALILCNYYSIHLESLSGDRLENIKSLYDSFEVELLKSQLMWLKSLLISSLSAYQYSIGDIEAAKTLIDQAISICPTSFAYRLKGAIVAWLLTHFKGDDDITEYDEAVLLKEYTEASSAAFTLDKRNPLNQLQYCEFLFHAGSLSECESRLMDIKLNSNYALQAELLYQLGRCFHVKGDYSKAVNSYTRAIGFKNDFLTARLQLIKAAVGHGNLNLAREHSDLLLQHYKKLPVILRTIGFAYLASAHETLETSRWDTLQLEGNNKNSTLLDTSCLFHSVQRGVGRLVDERLFKALSLLEEAIADNKCDILAYEYHGRCLEILISRGREYFCDKLFENYLSYKTLKTNAAMPLPIEWRNNYGVIAIQSRNYDDAISVFNSILEEIEFEEGQDSKRKTIIITVKFNLALAFELNGNIARAQRIHSQLTREYPKYTLPWIRRSLIAFKKRDYESSNRYLDQLKMIHPNSIEPWLHKAHQLYLVGSYDEAIQEIRRLFRTIPSSTYDPYTNTLLASIMIEKSYSLAESPSKTLVAFPKEALHYAKTGLRGPGLCNFYAANCISVILAHEKHLKPAYESFGLLLESLVMTPHMKFIANKNMAILTAVTALSGIATDRKVDPAKFNKIRVAKAQQHFAAALSNGILNKGVYFAYARFLFDVQKFDECISLLEVARGVFPDDVRFLYNQVIVLDGMLCSYLRDHNKAQSAAEMYRMFASSKFLISVAEYLIILGDSGSEDKYLTPDACNKLQQVLSRIRNKVMPHIEATLPQLEHDCEEKQKIREKRFQLQLTIQQVHESKQREQQEERLREAQAEEVLSQQLLKEASEIASELLLAHKSPTNNQ